LARVRKNVKNGQIVESGFIEQVDEITRKIARQHHMVLRRLKTDRKMSTEING
jgi:hypothetical protein